MLLTRKHASFLTVWVLLSMRNGAHANNLVAGVNPSYPAGEAWYYEVDYVTVPDQRCATTDRQQHAIPVRFLEYQVGATQTVKDFQCHSRCAGANAASSVLGCAKGVCSGAGRLGDGSVVDVAVCPAADTLLSKAVCGTMSDCKRVCDAIPYCYGFDWAKGSRTRCVLVTQPCQEQLKQGVLVDGQMAWDFVAKMDAERRGGDNTCALGMAMDAEGLHEIELNERYTMATSHIFLVNVTNASLPRVSWHYSGCGWVISSSTQEVYATWDDTDRDSSAPHCRHGDPQAPAESDLSATAPSRYPMMSLVSPMKVGLYDVQAFNKPVLENGVRFTSTVVCPQVTSFATKPSLYCHQNNVVVPTSSNLELVANQCYKKCLNGPIANFQQVGPDSDYCDGNDPSFNQFSNALCLPREHCERLCQLLPECVAIEMHKWKPRCYFNTAACASPGAQHNRSAEYDLLLKTEQRQEWTTNFLRSCSVKKSAAVGSALPPTLQMSLCTEKCVVTGSFVGSAECLLSGSAPPNALCEFRPHCERLCELDPNCGGFDMHHTKPWCLVIAATDSCGNAPAPYATGTAYHWIRREPVAPCFAKLDGHPKPEYNGDYIRQPAGGLYKHETLPNEAEIRWFPQSTGVACSGWYFREHDLAKYRSFGNVTATGCPTLVTTRPGEAEPTRFENEGLGLSAIFYTSPPLVPEARLALVCSAYPSCPLLTTCVMSKSRFASELALVYRTSNVYLATNKTHTAATLPQKTNILIDSNFIPRTIVSVERTTALIARHKWRFAAQSLFRNTPGSLKMVLRKPNTAARWDKLLVTLASAQDTPVGILGSASLGELGRTYPVPLGFDPWYSDVIRIEAFDTFLNPVRSPVTFDVYAPSISRLQCFVFSPEGASADQPLQSSHDHDFSVTQDGSQGNDGYWTVVVSIVGAADIVCTTEKGCQSAPSSTDANADVSQADRSACAGSIAGAFCPFKCSRSYVKEADWVCGKGVWQSPKVVAATAADCRPNTYSPELQLFRLTHRSRMDYGWKIEHITVASDADCAHPLPPSTVMMVGSSGHYTDKGMSHTIQHINVGGGAYWWSKCLNCNPYEVDETHGVGAYVDFVVASMHDIQCVKVASTSSLMEGGEVVHREYYPSRLALFRGFVRDTNGDEVISPGEDVVTTNPSLTHVKGWTKSWTHPVDEGEALPWVAALDGTVEVKIAAQCGLRDRLVFGELLSSPHDYFDGVPSPCHCQQLCIDHISSGCVSWKYRYACEPNHLYTGVQGCVSQRCFLQKNIKQTSGGEWGRSACPGGGTGFTGFVSGDTGLRLKAFIPAVVAPGLPFKLSVQGTNLPDVVGLHLTTPGSQRIKIVDEAAACAEAMPAEAARGIVCSSPSVCSSKPSHHSSAVASWDSLSVMSTKMAQKYSVCYNRGLTYDRYEWHRLPGTLTVASAPFFWSTEPGQVYRRTPSLNLTVTRAAFSSFSNTSEWRIKLVKAWFGCDLLTDRHLSIHNATGWNHPADMWGSADSATWVSIGVYGPGAHVGSYKVCFSDSWNGTFAAIPGGESGDDLVLDVQAEEGDSSQPRKVYGSQQWSAQSGVNNVLQLKGFRLLVPSTSKIAFVHSVTHINASGDSLCGRSETVFSANASVESDRSSADAYAASWAPHSGAQTGTYQVCYCDDQSDDTLDTTAGVTFVHTLDRRIEAGPGARLAVGALIGASGTDYTHSECFLKCSRGCTGSQCFCSGFDIESMTSAADAPDGAARLCLPAAQCAAVCEDITDCVGFDARNDVSLCYLTKVGHSSPLVLDEAFVHWEQHVGAPCTTSTDFQQHIGELHVSNRVDRQNDWILEPGSKSSLEVTGSGLNWLKDRVMVVDCGGTCGISPSASAIVLPRSTTGHSQQHAWNRWIPVPDAPFARRGMDPPSNNSAIATTLVSPPMSGVVQYVVLEQRYCPGNNLGLAQSAAAPHLCYPKCTVNAPCKDQECFCDGQYNGYDGPSSNALCLNTSLCQQMCTSLGDACYGIDMHRSKPRCFLNTVGNAGGCREYVLQSGLAVDANYDFRYKVAGNQRRLDFEAPAPEEAVAAEHVTRRLLSTPDAGYSWDQVLRWKNLEFRSGGEFKACFCDALLLPTNTSTCTHAADYKIHIGSIHVSGIFCLVKQKRYQRGVCIEQWHGGLRCYDRAVDVPVLSPPA